MPKVFTVSFSDNETMPERIEAMAADLGITSEMLIRRALAEHLGGYGLQEVPLGTKVKNLTEFLIHSELVNFSVTPAGVGASECLAVVAAR